MCDLAHGDSETATVFEWHRVLRSRTWHLCRTCDKVIPKGSSYWRNTTAIGSRPRLWSTEKQCDDCHDIGERFGEEHQWTPSPSYLLECVRGCVEEDGPGSKWAPALERIMSL